MLEGLYAGSLEDSRAREAQTSSAQLEQLISSTPQALNALDLLAPRSSIHVIAEIKRASPSKGDLAEIESAADLATLYADNGASAISVLTEQRKFKGALDDLAEVRERVTVPLLRKDFISTEYQLLEARAYGADIFLLIVAGLSVERLQQLKNFGESLGMTAFVETHSLEELKIASDIGARLIGVNARDLSTFETDRNLFSKLVEFFPSDAIKVAESAVREVADVRDYRAAGADVVLVGEALVTSDPVHQLREFLN